jgi:hypothetical protein
MGDMSAVNFESIQPKELKETQHFPFSRNTCLVNHDIYIIYIYIYMYMCRAGSIYSNRWVSRSIGWKRNKAVFAELLSIIHTLWGMQDQELCHSMLWSLCRHPFEFFFVAWCSSLYSLVYVPWYIQGKLSLNINWGLSTNSMCKAWAKPPRPNLVGL